MVLQRNVQKDHSIKNYRLFQNHVKSKKFIPQSYVSLSFHSALNNFHLNVKIELPCDNLEQNKSKYFTPQYSKKITRDVSNVEQNHVPRKTSLSILNVTQNHHQLVHQYALKNSQHVILLM